MFIVAGSTGNTGSVVARTLLERGEKVRVIAREPHKAADLAARGAEVLSFALTDTAALTAALKGARGAYLLVPPDMASADALAAQATLAQSLADAVSAARPEHVVVLSSVGAERAEGTGPIRSLHHAEKLLRAVAKQITFLRASYFMENLGSSLVALEHGIFPTFFAPETKVAMVATHDIGSAAANALLEGAHGQSVIELEGPARYSAADIASELSALTGKAIRPEYAPESAIVSTLTGFGMQPQTAELFREMIHGLNAGEITWQGAPARQLRGATPVRTVLAHLLQSAPH